LLILVALAGVSMGASGSGYRLWRLSRYYADLAQNSKAHESNCRLNAALQSDVARSFLSHAADYYAALARKHERAARYPWLPVEPDPPMP
jgi:hypothetical protein